MVGLCWVWACVGERPGRGGRARASLGQAPEHRWPPPEANLRIGHWDRRATTVVPVTGALYDPAVMDQMPYLGRSDVPTGLKTIAV